MESVKTSDVQQPQPFERYFTPQELADTWKLDESTVRRLFADEPGVMKLGQAGRRSKRDYVTLRIPESVAVRFWRARTGRTEWR